MGATQTQPQKRTQKQTRTGKNETGCYADSLTKLDLLVHDASNQMDSLSLLSPVSQKDQGSKSLRKACNVTNNYPFAQDTYLAQSETQLAANEFADDEQQTNDQSASKTVSLKHSTQTNKKSGTKSNQSKSNKLDKDFESRLVKPATKKTWISPYQTRNENLYFFLFRYKVYACPYRRNCPEKVVCQLFHHEGEKRRHPGLGPTFLYSEEACQQVKPFGSAKWLPQSRCANGDRCQFAHTILEQMYHPNIYKTSMCMNYSNPCGNRCKWGYYCTHAHGQDDIRPPISRRASHSRTPLAFETTNSLSEMMPVACAPVDKQGLIQTVSLDEHAVVGMEKLPPLGDLGWIMVGNNPIQEKKVISSESEQVNHGTHESNGMMAGCFADANIFWMNGNVGVGMNGGDMFKAVPQMNELVTREESDRAMMMYFGADNEPEFLKQLSPPAAQGEGFGLFDSDSEYENERNMESFPVNISLPFQWEETEDETEVMEWKECQTISDCANDKSDSLISAKKTKCESCGNVPQEMMELMQLLTPCGHVVCQSCYSSEMKCFLCNGDVFRALAYDCDQPREITQSN